MKFDLSQRREDLEKLDWVIRCFLDVEIPKNMRRLHCLMKDFQQKYLGIDPEPPEKFERKLNFYIYGKEKQISVSYKYKNFYICNDRTELDPKNYDLSSFYNHPLDWKLKVLQGLYLFEFWDEFEDGLIEFRATGNLVGHRIHGKMPSKYSTPGDLSVSQVDKSSESSIGSFIDMISTKSPPLDFSKESIEIPTWRDDIEPRFDNLNYFISLIYGLPFSVFKQCECHDCEKWFVSHKKNKKFCNPGHQKKHNDWSLTNDSEKKAMYKKKCLKQSERMAAKKLLP